MKRVLIITYYWPPVGGAGVQRWLKHTKYLREFGWEPVIYTAANPDLSVRDDSLLADIQPGQEVLSTRVWEPYDLYRRFTGAAPTDAVGHGFTDGGQKKGLTQRAGMWVRANFFIPDARRFWIRPSVQFLSGYLKDHPVDAIISTGPPQTTHLIALKLHAATGISWVADFRDPWTNNDFFARLPLTRWARRIHEKLEVKVLKSANSVVTVSKSWAAEMEERSGRKVDVITNGYDADDFQAKAQTDERRFILLHAGSMYTDRNPEAFWQAIAGLLQAHPELAAVLRIQLVGNIDAGVMSAARDAGVAPAVEVTGYESHANVLLRMQRAAVLLLLLNDAPDVQGRIPGKLFEYLAADRPVLCIGEPDWDSASIINTCNAGVNVRFGDADKMAAAIYNWYLQWKAGDLPSHEGSIQAYSRKSCAKAYADLLAQLPKKGK